MSIAEISVFSLYMAVLVILSAAGFHRAQITYLYLKHRRNRPHPISFEGALPRVTVQLPIYNEVYVVERLLESVSRLDYPKHLLEIQVLDDSTDETRTKVEILVRRLAAAGVDIAYHHRTLRLGFKAGALEAGLAYAKGEYIAIFDADFICPPEFLRRTLPYFRDADVGMVQTRWGHLNEGYSLLTRAQALQLDSHFILEQGGRCRSGRFFNFSGSAGIWRRAAIDQSGGWQHDTLTEDLDLSLRALLGGWRFVFLPDVISPAELPVEMSGYKSQQRRWAKGGIQTCCKLLPRIMRANIRPANKLEAFFHLTAYLNHPLGLILCLLMFPVTLIRGEGLGVISWNVTLFLLFSSMLSFSSFNMLAQRESRSDWAKNLKYLPLLLALGVGISVNNTLGVIEALAGTANDFARTPKYGLEKNSTSSDWMRKRYRRSMRIQPSIELGFGLYATATVCCALAKGMYAALPFLMLFQVGFLYTGLLSLWQQHRGWRTSVTRRQDAYEPSSAR